MDPAEVQRFSEVIQDTYNPNESARQVAEKMLAEAIKTPDTTARLFMETITSCPDPTIRQQACVLFRRYALSVADENRMWPHLDEASREGCKMAVLSHLAVESASPVRNALRNVLIQMIVEEQSRWDSGQAGHFWPEILEGLWHMANASGSEEQRESALLVLADVPLVFGNQLEKYLPEIQALLQACMSDESAGLSTQVAAVKAFIGFIVEMDRKEYRQYLQPMLPVCFQIVMKACGEGDEDRAIDCLSAMIELADDRPKFFKPHMAGVLETCHAITTADELEDDTRRMAGEIVMELCEADSGMMRKFPDVVDKFLPVYLQFCTDLEDDDEWSKQDADDIPDEEDNHTVGEQMIDRMSIALGGAAVLPKAFEYIPGMLSSERWQERAAGLTAIAAIGEGSLKEMKPLLGDIVENVVPRLLDEHPRVRYMACNAVGQLSLDFAPKPGKERDECFQTVYHETVIPTLLTLMQDQENPRVQAHGAAALVNFCEKAHEDILEPYLENILVRLMEMLDCSSRIVLEQTITCLATVADSAKVLFQRFYEHFMPHLKDILRTPPPDKDWRLLRGKTMECITLIGIAVTKEMFAADAREVMDLLAGTPCDDPDDPQITYIHAAWARICEVLGEDFVPYLGHVMEPLMRSLILEPEIRLLQPDEDPESLSGGAASWEVGATGESLRIGIKTAVLEEKRTACEMLRIYVQQLRGHFGPHIEDTSKIILGLLTFALDDEIRSLAVSVVPMLLTAALDSRSHGPEYAASLWSGFGPAILEAAKEESEIETQSYQIDAFNHSVEVLGIDCLSEDLMKMLTEILKQQLAFYDMRCADRMNTRTNDEDFDEEAALKMTEDEEFENDNIRQVGDLIHTLFGNAGDAFIPYFNELVEHFINMLQPFPARTHFDHHLGISIFDDLIEYCGEKSYEYIEHFGEAMITYLQDSDPDLRQACAYGIGVAAMHGGEVYTSMVASALPILNAMIAADDSRSHQNRDATENAISAIFKAVTFMPGAGATFDDALPQILEWLPIVSDDDEANFVYTQLCDKLKEGNEVLMRPDCLLRLFMIFAEVLGDRIAPLKENGGVGYCVGDTIKQTVLAFASANESAVGEIIEQIPDDEGVRSRFVQILQSGKS